MKAIIYDIMEEYLVDNSSNISTTIDKKLSNLAEQMELLMDERLLKSMELLNKDIYKKMDIINSNLHVVSNEQR